MSMIINPYRFGSAGDPYWANVTLLLRMNGSDGSTTFADSSIFGRTVTPQGGAQIDTSQEKFGGASGFFDGSGDWLDIDAPVIPLTGDFTIECWIRAASVSRRQEIIKQGSTSAGRLFFLFGADNHLNFFIGSGTNLNIVGTATIAADTWYHVAATRSGTTCRIFLDGVLDGEGSSSQSLQNIDTQIGRGHLNGREWDGWIDDVRVTAGVARYTANFTPPAAEFPDF